MDMLRYDSAFPFQEQDSAMIAIPPGQHMLRRVVLCRRGVTSDTGTPDRWKSFGWKLLMATGDSWDARNFATRVTR